MVSPSSRKGRLLSLGALSLLAWGVLHVAAGIWNAGFQLFGQLASHYGVPPGELAAAPSLARYALGVSAVWSGCIIGLGVFAMWLARGELSQGTRRAWLLCLAVLGPADLGAEICREVIDPPVPEAVGFPIGLALFLTSLILAAPTVWARAR